MNSLLYGSKNTPNIVATEVVRNKDNCMQVFYRKEDDTVYSEYIPYTPYTYISSDDPILEKFYEDTPTERLLGGNPLNLMVHSPTYSNIRWVEKNSQKSYTPFRQSQWMLQSGETQFKGMNFDDPLRLYFDLEVLTAEGFDFPNSSRPEDKIILIAIWTNRGHEMVLALNEDGLTPEMDNVYRCKDEKILIQKFVKCIRQIDPDIIANHNIFGFDFPYLRDRAQMLDVALQIGRDGSEPYTFNTSIKFAEKSDEYENFSIYGRHVLDTYFMAKRFDSVARKLDSLGLKACVKHLGKASDERTYIEGGDIADVWRGTHEKWTREDLIRYAIDDVKEAQVLDREWGRGIFEQTKMMPLPMQDVSRYGTANQLDLLFDREYYRCGWSIPVPDEREDYGGGYNDSFMFGYIGEPTVYMDVSSLYPTLMELLNIQPPKDELLLFQSLLTLLKEFRYKTKYKAQQVEDETLKRQLKAQDGGYKVLLNSLYGFCSWQWGKFNYYKGAALTTEWGQLVAKQMNKEAEVLGGQVVRTDTDGSLIIVPKEYQSSKEKETEFIKLVENNVNKWLEEEL
ncbi:MAG TPA: 3'-5' exonuclease [Massilibacterium sp.]|nr:3'-5' exonuclease [Massilibacterium sp.]